MKIEEIREALAGMTLPEIAEGTGVSPRAVFNFMHGKVVPAQETLDRMRAYVDGEDHLKQSLTRFDAALTEARAAMGSAIVNITLRAEQAERDLARLRSEGL
jgi:transcriptional regulator with XRE-family HTH domain